MTERSVTAKSVDEDLGELAQEVKGLDKSVSGLRTEFAEFRGRIETELGIFRGIAKGIAGKMFALIVAVILGMAGVIGGAFWVGWQMSSVVSKVDQHGEKLNDLKSEVKQLDGRLDVMAKQLDTIVRQTAPKAGG
jgi:archaellum component FlaC